MTTHPPLSTGRLFAKLLRTEQWYKNTMIFVPLIFAPVGLRHPLAGLALGFMGLCCISSISYIQNDWQDRKRDALHPTKKHRPLAAGSVSGHEALYVVGIIATVLVGMMMSLGWMYTKLVVMYFVLTTLYSYGLKNIPLLDISLIGTNFLIRLLAGLTVLPSGSHRLYAIFVFAMIIDFLTHKRRSDWKLLGSEKAAEHKPVLQYYTPELCYTLRTLSFVVMGFCLFSLQRSGHISGLSILLIAGLLGVTSVLFSRDPKLVMKPHHLFEQWWWVGGLGLVLLSLFV